MPVEVGLFYAVLLLYDRKVLPSSANQVLPFSDSTITSRVILESYSSTTSLVYRVDLGIKSTPVQSNKITVLTTFTLLAQD